MEQEPPKEVQIEALLDDISLKLKKGEDVRLKVWVEGKKTWGLHTGDLENGEFDGISIEKPTGVDPKKPSSEFVIVFSSKRLWPELWQVERIQIKQLLLTPSVSCSIETV